MSLTNPNIIERAIEFWRNFQYKRIALYAAGGLVLLASVLFAMDRYGKWRDARDVKKLQTNVNLSIQELKTAQDNLQKDRDKLPVLVANVAVASNSLLDAKNASEAARTQTNTSLQTLSNVVASNKRADVVVSDLEQRLNELEIR